MTYTKCAALNLEKWPAGGWTLRDGVFYKCYGCEHGLGMNSLICNWCDLWVCSKCRAERREERTARILVCVECRSSEL